MTDRDSNFVVARRYADLGWATFPLKKGGKTPVAGSHGCKDATTDRTMHREWFGKRGPYRDANIGIATGPISGIVVIDVDQKNGHDGKASLKALQAEVGKLPPTRESRTPSGGKHLYLAYDGDVRNSASRVADGVDVRGDGGYVVAPPSTTASGDYVWTREVAVADAPDEWIERLTRGSNSSLRVVGEGSRNDALTSEAGRMRAQGFDKAEALEKLLALNAMTMAPPLAKDEVKRIIESVWRYASGYGHHDAGNAQRLAHGYGTEFRYIAGQGFRVYDNGFFMRDPDGLRVMAMAKRAARDIYVEASAVEDTDRQRALVKWAQQSQYLPRLKAAVELSKSEHGIVAETDDFDRDPMLVAVPGGRVIDLRTGDDRLAARDDMLTMRLGCGFDPDATAPTWERMLPEILPASVVDYVRRIAGYALTGQTGEQCLFVLYGLGANGKSTVIETLLAMLGDYAKTAAFDTFAMRRDSRGGPSEDLARLAGARLVAVSEVPDAARLDGARVKDMTGGDRIAARRLYEGTVEYTPRFKPVLRANHRPSFDGADYAMARRVRLIEFDRTIPEGERDPELPQKLRAELPGILNWAIAGCLEWQRTGLAEPAEVTDATKAYIAEQDVVGSFFEDCVEVTSDQKQFAASADVYRAYRQWCGVNGHFPLAVQRFAQKVEERGHRRVRTGDGTRRYHGVRLKQGVEFAEVAS